MFFLFGGAATATAMASARAPARTHLPSFEGKTPPATKYPPHLGRSAAAEAGKA